ncbi:sel1 repeat family protein [Aestuariirhabdus sp. Z084]|uniref:tetratricopeptide repeat protein n=1 Tax=Aestuariirhabdus haliotis TaxID=2918751 RepID=UPI00201B39EF|nr:tetratricopeptide repeat protein [Aestuariirhabdus haliotis]MCL6415074.1 sel1 repeat family protein [Aestuariirhabdus haliotis]MCL6419006.1 sel1 repeat family protein [Aestuariirhabdus haliotis]
MPVSRTLAVLLASTLLLLSSPYSGAQPAPPVDYLSFDVNSLLVPASERCRIGTQETDIPYALAACEQAASNGDPEAQFLLGNLYYEGQIIPRDPERALKWFRRASEQGHANAQYLIAFMLYRGDGTNKNPTGAYIMIKMSAVNGFDDAMDAIDLIAEGLTDDEKRRAFYTLSRIFKSYRSSLAVTPSQPTSIPLSLPTYQ